MTHPTSIKVPSLLICHHGLQLAITTSEIRSNDHDNAKPWIAISYMTEAIKQTPQKFNPMTPLQCQRVII